MDKSRLNRYTVSAAAAAISEEAEQRDSPIGCVNDAQGMATPATDGLEMARSTGRRIYFAPTRAQLFTLRATKVRQGELLRHKNA